MVLKDFKSVEDDLTVVHKPEQLFIQISFAKVVLLLNYFRQMVSIWIILIQYQLLLLLILIIIIYFVILKYERSSIQIEVASTILHYNIFKIINNNNNNNNNNIIIKQMKKTILINCARIYNYYITLLLLSIFGPSISDISNLSGL